MRAMTSFVGNKSKGLKLNISVGIYSRSVLIQVNVYSLCVYVCVQMKELY